MHLKPVHLSAVLFAMTVPAHAESSGEMTVIIAGDEQVVPLWGSQSDWSGSESWPSISIYARAFDEDGEDPTIVTLGFDAPGWNPGGRVEMELTRYEDEEMVQRLYSGGDDDEGALAVAIDSHEIDGATLRLTGTFSGTMGTSDNYGRDIDLSDGVPVEGMFHVALQQLE